MHTPTSFETVPCNLCGSRKHSVIYEARYQNEKDHDLAKKFRASGDELLIDQLVRCSVCGLVFINPRLKSSLVTKAYAQGSDEVFVSQAAARERTFGKALKRIEPLIPHKGHLLDIGTAGGSFLAAARNQGWHVSGCELNRWMVRWGNKHYALKIQQGTVFEQKYKPASFDLVTLWDVIEHTPEPAKVIRECRRIMKPSGLLLINYPDIGSWIARLMGRGWLFLTSVHLYYFTRKTMQQLLEKEGFDILRMQPHFQELELGYLAKRLCLYSNLLSKIAAPLVKMLGLQHKVAPYWLGQTFVLARKR
jgi:2-polyprenyl-3-methyl-5-hydroxy-6-metoxy-1,4-benzoquinol methylase